MNIGLFFGSFNPIHTGHLIIAEHALNFYTDYVWIVVSPQNPYKNHEDLLAVKKRIHLVETAIKSNKKIICSTIELEMPTPSYTIDTLRLLQSRYANHKFSIIMGSDNYVNISQWKEGETIKRAFELLVYERPGSTLEKSNSFRMMKAPLINISATDIRNLINKQKSIRYLVPDDVIKIIEAEKLYATRS